MAYSNKLRYLLWAGAHFIGADTSCPACGEARTTLLKRKYGVTALYRCPSCEVMFRVPKPDPEKEAKFYQRDYAQGFTTDCPAAEELAKLKDSSFAGTEKDYSTYLAVLRALELEPGSSIFDFGCSWGYGSWQLRQAGFRVYSSELSVPRARYAEEKLECKLCPPDELPEKVDCFFSAHVIEHLTNPRMLWDVARSVIKPGGKIVTFLPNGDPSLERLNPNYHQLWGQVHPLLLSPLALKRMGESYGFSVRCYTSPYDMQGIAEEAPGTHSGDELLVVGTLLRG
jgi:Methyltransferase domain